MWLLLFPKSLQKLLMSLKYGSQANPRGLELFLSLSYSWVLCDNLFFAAVTQPLLL